MANPVIKDTLHTKDSDGNEIDVYNKTSDDQVVGLENYAKTITCDDHTLTITKGNGDTYEVEVSNEIITEEEIMTLWDITDSGEKYY